MEGLGREAERIPNFLKEMVDGVGVLRQGDE